MSLPTSRRFITRLFNSLSSISADAEGGANPLSAVPETAKKQLLSLQVLFPNEFLPALDLLDRKLVTRLIVDDGDEEDTNTEKSAAVIEAQSEDKITADPAELSTSYLSSPHAQLLDIDHVMSDVPAHEPTTTDLHTIYYVRSAQQRSSRYSSSYDTTTSYEVRLQAWNCSCPAFAFAAFPAVHPEPPIPVYDPQGAETAATVEGAWIFGGVSLGDATPPVCKHLLACVLVEKCKGLFGSFVEERVISVEEAAGWAAGWGD
jgi:hypothetical protein